MKKHENHLKAELGQGRLAAAEIGLSVASGVAEYSGSVVTLRSLTQQALEDAIVLLAAGFGERYGHDGHLYRTEIHHALMREVRERQEREGLTPPTGFRSRRPGIERRLDELDVRAHPADRYAVYCELRDCEESEKGERLVFVQPDWSDNAIDGEVLVVANRWTEHRPVRVPVKARKGRLLHRGGALDGEPVTSVPVPWDADRGVRILHAQCGLLAWEGLAGTSVRTTASSEQEEDLRLQRQA